MFYKVDYYLNYSSYFIFRSISLDLIVVGSNIDKIANILITVGSS